MKSWPDPEDIFAYFFTALTLTAVGNKGELANPLFSITVLYYT
jgi:hypothetical protein